MFRTDRPFRSHLLWLFAALLLVIGVPSQANAQKVGSFLNFNGPDLLDLSRKKTSCCSATEANTTPFTPFAAPEYETYRLTATYYSLRGGLATTLMLNNKGGQPILAMPTFYSMTGTRLQLAPIIVPAASYIDVDMHELLAEAGDEFQEGSMKIAYEGINTQLGCQVKMLDMDNGLVWAEQFVYTTKAKSSRLENVWWLPFNNSDTSVVVSNTSNAIVTLTMTVDGTSPHQASPTQIILAPWQTRVLDIIQDIARRNNGHLHDTGGISITHTGAPGAVLARMFISKTNKGYSAANSFVDPEQASSQKISGLGLRLKNLNGADLDQILVARNTHSETSHVNGRVRYTTESGVQTIAIPPFSMSAGSSKRINLSNLLNSISNAVSYAGIEVEYDSPEGSLITSVQSLSNDGNQVFEVPMLDPANIPSTSAGFPWKADGDFRTIIYAKNESLLPQKFATHLVYEGGQYSTGEVDIEPGQTIAVDFRELRDSQTPDKLNRVIPIAADKGQIAWTKRRGQAKSLSVRSEQISVAGGIASTYSCANNCCDNRDLYGWVNPTAINEVVGGFTYINGTKVEENCMLQQFQTPIENAYWSSSDTDVEVIGYGTAEAVGPGYAEIHADWTPVYYLYGPSLCEDIGVPRRDSAPAEVTLDVQSVVPGRAPVGATVDVDINGSGFPYSGSITVPAISGVTVTDVYWGSANKITAKFQVASNASGGNRSVKVTIAGKTSVTSANFFVQIPTKAEQVTPLSSVITHDPTPGNMVSGLGQVEASNVCGGYRNFSYRLLDQVGEIISIPLPVTELLSNYQGPSSLNIAQATTGPTIAGIFHDFHAVWATPSNCPPAFSYTENQGFKVVLGQNTYTLSSTYQCAGSKSSSGIYSFTATNVTP